jgi:hypothetical protein
MNWLEIEDYDQPIKTTKDAFAGMENDITLGRVKTAEVVLSQTQISLVDSLL